MADKNIDINLLLERISYLADIKGITMNTAFVESGVGKNFKSNLRNANPSMGKITMLANYFGVSVEYLLGKDDTPPNIVGGKMFWKNFFDICKDRGESPNAVAKKLGISSGSVTSWKNGRVPHFNNLQKIAEYFNITVDQLLSENPPKARDEPNAIFLEQQNVHMIPLFESVSAGFGALAVNEIVDYIPLFIENPTEAAETLCIKVTGDSMYPKIEDGDIIQVHKQDSVDSGSIAVVLLDGEDGLVKKVIYGETWIELHSINPFYKPMRFNGPDVMRVRVLGKVNKVIKNV